MNAVDGLILAIVGISCLISIKRGFVKEALSLLIWIAAAVVSFLFHGKLAFLLSDVIALPMLRTVVAAVALFVTTLLVGALVNMLIGQLIKLTGLSGTDRVLGVVFGFFRGVIIVMFVMMLFPPILELEKYELWQSSVLIPHLSAMETGLVKLANQILGTAA